MTKKSSTYILSNPQSLRDSPQKMIQSNHKVVAQLRREQYDAVAV